MNPDEPFGLLITWTCYGTWLPGDRRGYVSDTLRPHEPRIPKQNTPGTPYAVDDEYTRRRARQRQKWPTVYLTRAQASVVAERLLEAAKELDWRILRGAVMSDHVHIVVVDCPDDGPAVRRVLKGTAQAQLSKHLGRPRRWWTQGGSDRYLHTEHSIRRAIDYVARQKRVLAEIADMELVEPER